MLVVTQTPLSVERPKTPLMRQLLTTLFVGLLCLVTGLGLGIWLAPQLKLAEPTKWVAANAPWAASLVQPDANSPYEMYAYPNIKWRPKLLAGAPESIAQLSTTFEASKNPAEPGTMKYRLTIFKAPNTQQCGVQLLDGMGFKIWEFNVNQFHKIPGAPDVMEARDNIPFAEDAYKKACDYSVN